MTHSPFSVQFIEKILNGCKYIVMKQNLSEFPVKLTQIIHHYMYVYNIIHETQGNPERESL